VADSEHLVRDVEARLCRDFGIGHATMQVEICHPCTDDVMSHQAGAHTHEH